MVRRMITRFNEQGIEAAGFEFFADDVEFREPPEQPGARVARGRKETTEFFAGFEQAWTQHRSEPEEIRAVDKDRVLYLSVEHFRGRDGIEVAQPAASIFTLRQGKLFRWQGFWNREAALEAAGLRE